MIDDLFKKILDRQASQEELNRFNGSSKEEIINLLTSCKEKYSSLHSKGSDYTKTSIVYTDNDINEFFSSKKYKVALCLSGHLRNYEKNLASINKFLINPLNADVFIHTWDSVGKQIFLTKGRLGPIPDESGAISDSNLNLLNNIKLFKIENNNLYLKNIEDVLNNKFFHLYGKMFGAETFVGQAEPKYIFSQFYSIYQSYKLLEDYSNNNNIKYDIVIKLRTDYQLSSGIFLEDLKNIVNNKNFIYIPSLPYSNHGHPSCCLCLNKLEHLYGHVEDVCDVFSYSNYENMKKYMTAYEQLDNIREIFLNLNNDILKNKKYSFTDHKNYKIIDIWRDTNYDLNCFYPERIFRFLLKDYILLPSKLSGMVLR